MTLSVLYLYTYFIYLYIFVFFCILSMLEVIQYACKIKWLYHFCYGTATCLYLENPRLG